MTHLHSTAQAIYEFICVYQEKHGYAPTLREIATACYIGRSSVLAHLGQLEGRGYIEREAGKARSIRILKPLRRE